MSGATMYVIFGKSGLARRSFASVSA